jgi:ABC-type multidrug transport system fused ATPase/permease subunit
MFSMMAFAMHKLLDERAQKMGQIDSNLQIKSNRQIQELFSSYRETLVQNSQGHLLKEIVKVRSELADTQAEMAFMPNVSKYIIESSVILFAFLLSAIQFVLQDANQAITALATFLAAGTRMAPALLRIQQATLKIRHHRGHSLETLQKIKEIDQIKLGGGVFEYEKANSEFSPQIEVRNVSLTYPGSPRPTLVDVSLNVSPGEMIAITGPSGSGKTSLVDLVLGVIHPSLGEVTISGVSPRNCFEIWPGNTAYVPQTIFITNGTVRENICLGLSEEEIDDSRIWSVLESVSLKDFVSTLPNQLDSLVGESGTSISGGQRQRLGIARAMFTKPKLLVLDEATSALDGQTESEVSEAIAKLQGTVTVVMIAHRLSTVQHADQVIYMSQGEIVARGTFNEVRSKVPDFDKQAQLMGL